MSTLQERMALAKQHYEKTQGKKFKNVELAEYCKVSKVSIGQWLNGPTKELEGSNLTRAADFFGVNHKWLAGERSQMLTGHTTSLRNIEPISSLIPLISWQQANQPESLKNIDANHKDWLAAHPNMVKDCYALKVLGESMLPEFRPNDHIYVTTNIKLEQLKTGDFVIVQNQEYEEALFKRLVLETEGMFLQVLNETWPQQTIPLTGSFKIVAKVVGFWRTTSFV